MHTFISNNKRKSRYTSYGEEKVMHPDLNTLEKLLKTHDWYYEYSDDHRVWQRGRDERDEIRRQQDICCGLGLGDIATAMVDKYSKSL